MVIIRIHLPSTRIWFTALNDCDPPLTCITANVFPCVGLTAPTDSGIQSIIDFMTPLIAPWRSGEHQTWPSDQAARSRSSCTFGWVSGAPSGSGNPCGSKMRVSAPNVSSRRAASKVRNRLYDRARREP